MLSSKFLFSLGLVPTPTVRQMAAVGLAAMLAPWSPEAPRDQPSVRRFERHLLLEPEGVTSASVSIGDLDGDRDLDLVLAKGRHWPLHNLVMRNDGKGNFSSDTLDATADRTYSAALADLDGDADLDLVVSNDRPDSKRIYVNDGAGHFQNAGTFGHSDWTTRYVTLADVNGDRRPDILVANRSGDRANPRPSYVCLNDGQGAFPACRALATESATIIVAADLDGDGLVDLFVPHRDGGQNLVFWNDGRGTFDAPPTPVGPPSSAIRAAASNDVNGDGRLDLVVGDEKTGLFLHLNVGARRFGPPAAIGSRSDVPYSIATTDLNRDERIDIVVGNDASPGAVYFNKGGVAPSFEVVRWNDGKGAVYGVAIGDLDGDGWPDIAAARSGAPNGVWFNGAAGTR